MILQFLSPISVPNHFEVLPDQTPWEPQIHQSHSQGWSPVRERASFVSWSKSLIPNTATAKNLEGACGLYLFAANEPQPTLYIGIASSDADKPEGFLKRLKKHRTKATGSHVGTPTSTGGVHHPEKWRDFACQRFNALGGSGDTLEDVRFITSSLIDSAIQPKAILENFEDSIMSNHDGILDQIVDRLWPGKKSADVTLLNGTPGHRRIGPEDIVNLWPK